MLRFDIPMLKSVLSRSSVFHKHDLQMGHLPEADYDFLLALIFDIYDNKIFEFVSYYPSFYRAGTYVWELMS